MPDSVFYISSSAIPSGVTIICYESSAAYNYAVSNGNPIVPLTKAKTVTFAVPATASGFGSVLISGEDIPRYISEDAVLFLPEGVASVGAEAFAGIPAQQIVIPSGCGSIGSGAFAGCSSLRLAVIPASVTSIAADAFSGCGDIVIYCAAGSRAERFAKEQNLMYYTPVEY
ncbi:MAG: hypothetical protein CW338_07580 [Clostridiales bacterium]|nr:hypothetical protein [Clostridiales bacterium]